jgi:hypothetical protein
MIDLLIKIINFTLILILSIALIIFVFWRFGIFEKEPELSQSMNEIKSKIEFIQNYKFFDFNQYLQRLTVVKIEIPPILPEEIGKPSLF